MKLCSHFIYRSQIVYVLRVFELKAQFPIKSENSMEISKLPENYFLQEVGSEALTRPSGPKSLWKKSKTKIQKVKLKSKN